MARKLRIQYAGAVYHIMNRGDHQEDIFLDDDDRRLFLVALEEVCQKTSWQVHAFCLMSNHFHLVLETPSPNLVEGMKWLLGVYTRRFNARHRVFGHLFASRYKALIVEGGGNGYLKTVGDYVHLNPVRAGLLGPEQPLETFRWSSYPLYIGSPAQRPNWLRIDRLMGEWRIDWRQPEAGQHFAASIEARRQSELEEKFKPIQRGWCLGSEAFRAQMLEYVERQRGKWHYGAELWESAQAKAEQLIASALKAEGLSEQHLADWPKGHPFKVALALRLRKETTVTMSWLAQRLRMGTRGYLAHLLNQPLHTESPSQQRLAM